VIVGLNILTESVVVELETEFTVEVQASAVEFNPTEKPAGQTPKKPPVKTGGFSPDREAHLRNHPLLHAHIA